MRTALIAIITVVVASAPAFALDILVPGYTVETYAAYTGAAQDPPGEMTFDANDNLYLTQDVSGTLHKITPAGVVTLFASGFTSSDTIEWGGGTAYGDYLYVGESPIYKVDLNGNKTPFANVRCDASLTIDRTGNYGGYLYNGTGCIDDIKRIDTAGNIMTFSSWPGQTDGGAPYGIAFDPGTAYGGLMFVGAAFQQNNAAKSGLFSMGTSGIPTRFSNNLVLAYALDFDKTGSFGNLLFAVGATAFNAPGGIYSVGTNGFATLFATSPTLTGLGMIFGPDGALYVCEYSSPVVTICRIAPEPVNKPPIADAGPDQTVYAWIDGIAEVNLDASGSYDEDGDELTYLWKWVINENIYDTNSVNPTIELPVGQHTITLVVNDGLLDSEPNEVNITVIGPIEVNLCVTPKILNCRCPLPRIIATLRLPGGITKDQIDTNVPLLLYPGEIEADWMRIGRLFDFRHRTWNTTIFAAFDKDTLMDAINDYGRVEVMVVGRLKTGQYFFGTDYIMVICPGKPPCHHRWDYRWNCWCHRPSNCRK